MHGGQSVPFRHYETAPVELVRLPVGIAPSLGLSVLVTVALRHAASSTGHGISVAVASADGYALTIADGICLFAALVVALTCERLPKTATPTTV
jgi:hypothetical protein